MDFALGAHPSPTDHRDLIITDRFSTAGPLPTRFVWTPMGPVLNQGSKPECVAYAFAGMKLAQELRESPPQHPVFDEDWFYAECKKIDGIPGDGTTGRAAATVLYKLGYRTVGHKDEAAWKIGAYYGVPLEYEIVKRAVFEFGPVPISMQWFGNWFGGFLLPNYILPDPKGSPVGGHEVLVFGWDDRKLAGSNRQGFLIARNSWGTRAQNRGATNDSGNFYIPWDLFHEHGWDAFKSVDVKGDYPGHKEVPANPVRRLIPRLRALAL